MAFKFVAFAALVAIVNAATYDGGHGHGHAVSYSSVSHGAPSHGHGHGAPAIHAYHHVPEVQTYHAPVHTYHHVAPVVAKVAVAPVVHKVAVPVQYHHHHQEEEHHAPAHYSFEYSVHDPHTHDIKEQKETREGDVVKGMYSLVEPDGSKRIVEYTADKHNGFQAVVHREHSSHPAPVKVAKVAPVKLVAAPVHYTHAAPQYYHHHH